MNEHVTNSFMAELKEKISKLKELAVAFEAAKEAAELAEQDYLSYKNSVVLAAMVNSGFNELTDEAGTKIKLETKYYCSPNKNEHDRQVLRKWLVEQGGSFLLKDKAEVDGAQLDALKETGIPFVQKSDVNTLSLKAFIINQLGVNGGTAQIKQEDIPECIHFSSVADVVMENV